MRATKAKKSAMRKPTRPGKITTTPKSKKASLLKKASIAKKTKSVTAKRPSAAVSKRATAKKGSNRAAKPAPKIQGTKRALNAKRLQKQPPPSMLRKVVKVRARIIVPKPAPPPPKKPPSPGTLAAVKAFEQALKLFNRHDFSAAKPAFNSLLSKFAEESEILARVRTYLAICEQRLARAPQAPRNPDALYDQGVIELNRGNTSEAVELFQKALKADPRADHVYYSLAAAHARLDDASKALDALRRAIVLRPIHRSHARRDLDFVGLRASEDFQQLTGFGFDLIENE